ncbi:hypothetical protein [Candidatus Frankia nodulisporulans]|uniref:hypothetical protein n=1 Tax=Candidatus Frankia nodulisporulans TaxID=2060052 RepID=UPI001FD2A289|nr:hypothetical protein [Candidatus Frankia nodulisporulans]
MVTRSDDPRPSTAESTPLADLGTGPVGDPDASPAGEGDLAGAGRGRRGGRRRLGWRRHRVAPAPEAPVTVMVDGTAVITVAAADFVCCSYQGCGTLRPLAEAVEHRPCPGCGRV